MVSEIYRIRANQCRERAVLAQSQTSAARTYHQWIHLAHVYEDLANEIERLDECYDQVIRSLERVRTVGVDPIDLFDRAPEHRRRSSIGR